LDLFDSSVDIPQDYQLTTLNYQLQVLMSHSHPHDSCGNESHDHDHEHGDSEDVGPEDNLFRYIDRDNVVALNTSGGVLGSVVIKPWHKRLDDEQARLYHSI
jgi:hypothetical protein